MEYVREQEKPEVRKILENGDEFHLSSATMHEGGIIFPARMESIPRTLCVRPVRSKPLLRVEDER